MEIFNLKFSSTVRALVGGWFPNPNSKVRFRSFLPDFLGINEFV